MGAVSFFNLKRSIAVLTITFHLVIFIPNQSKAALPLVPIAAAAVGGLILAAGAADPNMQFNAPAVWDATQQAVSAAGDTARLAYGLVKVPLVAGGEKLYGKLCTLGMKFGDLKDWVLNNPDEAPILSGVMDDSSGIDPQIGDIRTVTNTTTCDTSTVEIVSTPNDIGPGSYDIGFVSSYMCGGCSSGLTFKEGSVFWIMGAASVSGDQCNFSSRVSYNAYLVDSSTPLTPLSVDPAAFAGNLPASEDVAKELEKAMGANPDKVIASDTDDASVGASGTAPPLPKVNDTSPYHADASAESAKEAAVAAQALADASPDDASLQIAALEAQVAAQQASLEAVQAQENTEPLAVDLSPVVAELQNIDSKLAAQNEGMELSVGEATINPNSYDPNFEQPPEDDFKAIVAGYITSGLPYSDVIKQSRAVVASSDPVIRYWYKEQEFTIDFTPFQGVLQIMGAGVFFASILLSYFIIVGKS